MTSGKNNALLQCVVDLEKILAVVLPTEGLIFGVRTNDQATTPTAEPGGLGGL